MVLSYLTDNAAVCVAVLSIAFGFNGAIYAGHTTNGLTIAPNRFKTKLGFKRVFKQEIIFVIQSSPSPRVFHRTNLTLLVI